MPDAPKLPPIRPTAAARPRTSTTARGYGWKHQQQRARLIALHPICQRCGDGWSAHLHHIDRNPHNHTDGNVELLCERCHEREHTGR
jgi:5-methylcytosine-specific restriction endonuclease McrA